jgi:hypothetical protein
MHSSDLVSYEKFLPQEVQLKKIVRPCFVNCPPSNVRADEVIESRLRPETARLPSWTSGPRLAGLNGRHSGTTSRAPPRLAARPFGRPPFGRDRHKSWQAVWSREARRPSWPDPNRFATGSTAGKVLPVGSACFSAGPARPRSGRGGARRRVPSAKRLRGRFVAVGGSTDGAPSHPAAGPRGARLDAVASLRDGLRIGRAAGAARRVCRAVLRRVLVPVKPPIDAHKTA